MDSLTARHRRILGRRFLAGLGVSAIPIGILAPLYPAWWEGTWWILILVALLAAAWAFLGLVSREPSQQYSGNFRIRIVTGDLFRQQASAMIGMTTTFDTLVPDVIARDSVQGGFLGAVYDGSTARLDSDLSDALVDIESVGHIDKPGKQVAYPLATVVTLRPPGAIKYYCAAYTVMDEKNRATGTIRGVLDSLDEVWDLVDANENGATICVPIIGQGQSRIPELTAEMSVRLIAFSFLLRSRRSRFSGELRIVIRPQDRPKFNFAEMQAFLSSLAT